MNVAELTMLIALQTLLLSNFDANMFHLIAVVEMPTMPDKIYSVNAVHSTTTPDGLVALFVSSNESVSPSYLLERFPALNTLMQKIQWRKRRDSYILGAVIAFCMILIYLYTSR
jgi:hypothetical protein